MKSHGAASVLGALLAFGVIVGWARNDPKAEVWSEAENLTIPSREGPLAVVKQSLEVPGGLVELVYCPSTGALLIGVGGAHTYSSANGRVVLEPTCFGLGGRLWSAVADGSQILQLRGSVATVAPGEVAKAAERWVEDFRRPIDRQKPGNPEWFKGVMWFDLWSVFGVNALLPVGFEPPIFSIRGIELGSDAVKLLLRSYRQMEPGGSKGGTGSLENESVGGEDLEVVYSSEFKLLSAKRNGVPVLPLLDGRMADEVGASQDRWWFWPFKVLGTNGWITVPSCVKDYMSGVLEKAPGIMARRAIIPYVPSLRVMALPTGELWIGPSSCKVVWLNGRLLGFTVFGGTGELVAYAGPRPRISMADGERIAACGKVLAQVEKEVASGAFPPPDRLIKISDLYGADEVLANERGLRLMDVALKDDRAVLEVSGVRGERLRIAMTPDLAVVATDRIPPGSTTP